MAKRIELHLEGMDAPAGLIDADRLVEIVKSLQEMATRLGRIETDSAQRGRPSKNLERVASLRIGLEEGSTTIIAERDVVQDSLDLDLPDEEAVDRKFAEFIESIGSDQRPDWVTGPLASTADDLVVALQRTAPKVELKIDGVSKLVFETKEIHRETWNQPAPTQADAEIKFTGRLFAVNLNTHYLQVQDDVGNKVALPKVANDIAVKHLIGSYVTITGAPELDSQGRISSVRNANIVPMVSPQEGAGAPASMTVEDILASAPGLEAGGLVGLTDDEADAFFEAMGL